MTNRYNPSSNAFKNVKGSQTFTSGNLAYSQVVPAHKTKNYPKRKKKVEEKPESKLYKGILVGLIIVSMCVCVYVAVLYLNELNKHKEQTHEITQLEHELKDLKTKNDNIEHQFIVDMDINYIYDIAVNELGMVFPEKENIVLYPNYESSFVIQYQQIPEKE